MTVTEFTPDAGDLSVYWSGTSYPTPTSSTGLSDAAESYNIGQQSDGTNWVTYQTGLGFDTSSLAGHMISAATLTFFVTWPTTWTGAQSFIVEVYAYDWGASIDTGDLRTAAQLNGLTMVASKATGYAYNDWTTFDDVALAANINKTGVTKLWMASSRWRNGNAPTTTPEYTQFSSMNGANPPKLTVTHQATARTSVASVPTADIKSVAGTLTAGIKSVAGVA